MIQLKKLMPLALLAAAAWAVWKFVLPRVGPLGGAVPGGFFDAGNQQLGETWWNLQELLRGGGPQRNNPVTGNPIPDATMYPNDPGGWYNA